MGKERRRSVLLACDRDWGDTMRFQNTSGSFRCRRSSSALVGLALLFAALGLSAPALAQFTIGIGPGGGGGIGIGLGGGPAVQDAPPPRAGSSGEHRSHKTKSARHSSDDRDRHPKEARKNHGDGDSSSRGAGADETSFPSR
jgi:hypothetical protein